MIALLACTAEPPVFAASSLTEVTSDLGAEHGWSSVTGASQLLRFKIDQGARWRGFISADIEHVQGLCPIPVRVAEAPVVAIVPLDSPLDAFEDLEAAERVVLGDPAVPAGRYADQLLERDGLSLNVVSREANVRQVRAKVLLGEADAAIVYATDATDALRVLAPSAPLVADWWACGDPDVMQVLVSAEGRATFQRHGFTTP